jgi:putative transposase
MWQRRFWEHQIQDENDYILHVEYVRYNPAKHNLVSASIAWAYSSFGRYVEAGVYSANWGAEGPIALPDDVGHE